LRYAPPGASSERVQRVPTTSVEEATSKTPQPQPEGETPKAPGQRWNPQDKIQLDRPKERVLRSGKIWVLNAQRKPEPRDVTLGITDGASTEVVSGSLKPNEAVIIGDSSQAGSQQQTPQNRTMNPFMLPPRGGGRGR
jgi:hypothetical protein